MHNKNTGLSLLIQYANNFQDIAAHVLDSVFEGNQLVRNVIKLYWCKCTVSYLDG